ncbi:DEAD/DEAH box helicase [Mesomycoplasma lagogenitalium]|uniref:DEAD/DEAH box helicase n=1 Tax=Mesomycoplasma lagogenitalium TaxID=171286 RepID=A0ABY8LW69_9BACT|nr:DEAD/DEAH box helicase [Mesomycoplasma lagogenitalium]WGI36372.1 DEAD/DEAH box helicase [Mesomycoplasma lagogenitalium]
MGFEKLNISEKMLVSLKKMGFDEPTDIQKNTIKLALSGKDIIGQAQTGTGKTAAFAIPIIENTDINNKKIQHLVIAPTRELATQIHSQFELIGKNEFNINVGLIVGGISYDKQLQMLKSHPQIIIATPGRLNDLIENTSNKKMDLSEIKSLTLDEADELLKIGFYDEIVKIIDKLPENRQNFFFTATFDKKTKKLSEMITKNPVAVSVSQGLSTSVTIKQEFVVMKENAKLVNLIKFLEFNSPKSVVVFGRTKKRVDELSDALREMGYKALGIQGDMQQRERNFVMDKFRRQEISILVATDVMARGIDVDHVEWVVNFDLPQEIEYYTHRIGRTGRAGREGYSLSFVKLNEVLHMERIAIETNSVIEEIEIPSDLQLKTVWETKLFKKLNSILEKNNNAKYTNIQDDLFARFSHKELAILLAEYISNTKNNRRDIKLTPEPSVVLKKIESFKEIKTKSKKTRKKEKFIDKKISSIGKNKKTKKKALKY